MIEKAYRSKCCNADVRAGGLPDFVGSKEVCTVSYACLNCGKPCDVATPKGQKQKVCAVKKSKTKIRTTVKKKQRALKERIKEGEKRLDFQGKVLKKLVEFFDGITIHPVKGVVLTSKKKRQLAELQEMAWSGNIFKKRIKKPHK